MTDTLLYFCLALNLRKWLKYKLTIRVTQTRDRLPTKAFASINQINSEENIIIFETLANKKSIMKIKF